MVRKVKQKITTKRPRQDRFDFAKRTPAKSKPVAKPKPKPRRTTRKMSTKKHDEDPQHGQQHGSQEEKAKTDPAEPTPPPPPEQPTPRTIFPAGPEPPK